MTLSPQPSATSHQGRRIKPAFALAGAAGCIALWVVLASLAYLTWWALHDAHLGSLWSRPGKGGLSFWQGVDLMVAMPVSWLPLAADYTRFSRSGRGAFWGAAVGYFVPTCGSTRSARSCCSRAGLPMRRP